MNGAYPGLLMFCLWCASCDGPKRPELDPAHPSPNVVRWSSPTEDRTDALVITSEHPRVHLYCGPSVLLDQPVIALRCSAQVLKQAGSGRLRAYVVVHGEERWCKEIRAGRVVRPGELPQGEWTDLALEVKLNDVAHDPEDRYELVLANEAASDLQFADVRITSVTADVPGRPPDNGIDSKP